jgi:GNAT superfamily N-acetyltransferase
MIAGAFLDQKIKISPLSSKEALKKFRCGEREIDDWAYNKAHKYAEQGRTKVFTAHVDGNDSALGFYALNLVAEDGSKLLSRQDRDRFGARVPLVYIQYLAVLRAHQRNKIGTLLLINSLSRAYAVSRNVAFYGVGLRSLNAQTAEFYERYGFKLVDDSPTGGLMVLPIWTVGDLLKVTQ